MGLSYAKEAKKSEKRPKRILQAISDQHYLMQLINWTTHVTATLDKSMKQITFSEEVNGLY